MKLARSDTYINVYLPRPDGEDPRRFVSTSPVYEDEKVYKFSDQMAKDRPLFLGKKSLSLYEIYYKNKETQSEPRKYPRDSSVVVSKAPVESEKYSRQITTLGGINTVSLFLDSDVKKTSQDIRRFNEPLNAYVSNKKRAQMMTRFDSDVNLERQITSYEMTPRKRENTFFEKKVRPRPPRIPYKIQSALETRLSNDSLGLPPIVQTGGNRVKSSIFPMHSDALQKRTVVQAMPIRPSSKPQAIWRQSTETLLERHTIKPRVLPMKHLSAGLPVLRQVAQ